MGHKAVFLDRDGVLNRTIFRDGKPRAPDHLHEFEFLPGVAEAIALLKQAGFLTIVVTNQPDVARGWQKKEVVEAMNEKVLQELKVDALKTCFHDAHHECECRKPKPGMLIEAATEWDIDLIRSFMVGDRHGDIEAGNRAGCTSILVGSGEMRETETPSSAPNNCEAVRLESLSEAVKWITAYRSLPLPASSFFSL